MAIYDCVFVIEFMVLRGLTINASSILTNLLTYVHANSIFVVPIVSFFKHFLSSVAMIGTISIGYYGSLKKENVDLLEAFQVLEKV